MIAVADLKSFSARLLVAAGASPETSELVAQALVAADVEGIPSHGVGLLPMYLSRVRGGSVDCRAEPTIVSDRRGAIVLDAHNAFGQVSSHRAVQLARGRLSEHAVVSVAVRNGFHFGAAGYWARMLAEDDCVGVVMCNTRPLMPAPGGGECVVGNNPIAIAVPAEGEGLVLDLALSMGAMGKIRLAAAEGRDIPAGWAADSHGQPTTDPHKAITGLLLPAGGAKGFGLAFMVDLLAGGLSSGAVGSAVTALNGSSHIPYGCSHLFLAFDLASFCEPSEFRRLASARAQAVRASTPTNMQVPVRMFGDRAAEGRAKHAKSVDLPLTTTSLLAESALQLNVPCPF